ncbi:MAG TPA: FG-GAP-like repeat-containing protein, partial [bacterium]|nr:FG-GAP-like repeat-containing protein [bacterium]
LPLVFAADIKALTNGDRLSIFLGVSCNPNQVDLECMGEAMMNNPNGGMAAVIASTREDFPVAAAAQTSAMLSMAFDYGFNGLGEMSQLGRVRYAAAAASDLQVDRWTWLAKMLLGDPELRIWTQEPAGLVVSHPPSVPLGASGVTVTVQDSSATAVAGALVCLSDGAGTYSRGLTDGAGSVTLPITSTQTGTLSVVATKGDYRPHESSVTLGAAGGPFLAHVSDSVDDDNAGSSSGNGDGVVDAGETVELGVTVENAGVSTANSSAVQGTIESGTSATFNLLYSGVPNAAKVFIGPDRVNPGAVPFTLDFASPSIPYIGRPSITFAPDSLGGPNNGDTGIFVWQDNEGWHVVWGSGSSAVTVTGTVTTDGRVRGASSLALEAGETATITAGEDTLSFSGTTGAQDTQDGVDFALSDGTMLSLTTSSAALGNIPASGQAAGTLVYDVSSTARTGQIAYVDLSLTSTSGGPWSGEVPVVFAGPDLEAYVFSVEDSGAGLSGDGDGVVEVGETVRLTPTVRNRGNGSAVAVTGAATAASGITFTDAGDSYGEIASLSESSGTDGYVFTVDDGTGTSLDLTLTDQLGRTWEKTMDFVPPVPPDSLWYTSTGTVISVHWTRPDTVASPDVAGYNVYRSATQGSGHTRHNVGLVRGGALFRDEGLALGSMYYYYVTAVDSSGNESAATAELTAWTTQVQVDGWPRLTTGFNIAGTLITDADKDRFGEVYQGSHDSKVYGWDHTGTIRSGFPIATAFQVWGAASAADMDQDGDEEIFFGSRDSRLYAVHADGSPVYGGSAVFADLPGGSEDVRSTVTLADFDNDGRLEMLAGSDLGHVYAYNHDATGVIGTSGVFFSCTPTGLGARVWGPFAVADLENDGNTEIAFGSWNDSLYVVNEFGALRPGFPKGGAGDFRAGAVFADIDNDGTMEILATNYDGNLYAWNHDGTDYVSGGILATLPAGIPGEVAVANLDGDPELELIVGCFDANLYAFNHDGSSFLVGMGGLFVSLPPGPQPMDGINATPIVVDVDGDTDFEIFVGHRNHNFYGFHHDGSLMVG